MNVILDNSPAYNFIDLSGQRFGRLIVLHRVEDKIGNGGRRKVQYLCKCDCGQTKIIIGESLRSGRTISCGCYASESIKKRSTKHGKRYERIYSIFCDMKKRCYNKKDKRYSSYGGRGITICDEWLNDFNSFYDWSMEHGYREDLTIDRIDNDGNYEPLNCQWITRSENSTKRNIEYWRKRHECNVR